jgi:hypothetical protein
MAVEILKVVRCAVRGNVGRRGTDDIVDRSHPPDHQPCVARKTDAYDGVEFGRDRIGQRIGESCHDPQLWMARRKPTKFRYDAKTAQSSWHLDLKQTGRLGGTLAHFAFGLIHIVQDRAAPP